MDKTIEFCDESGKVLGQFVPSEDVRLQVARENLLAVTEEEWDRIRSEEGEYTTEEVLKRLEKA